MVEKRPEGLLGANETRRRLGDINSGTLTQLVRTGKIKPAWVDERGWKYFDPEDVERFAQVYRRALWMPNEKRKTHAQKVSEGKRAAKVFDCFRKGMSIRDIVPLLSVSPGYVRDLWAEWNKTLGAGEAEKLARIEEREHARIRREQERLELIEERNRIRRRELDIRERELRLAQRAAYAAPPPRAEPAQESSESEPPPPVAATG